MRFGSSFFTAVAMLAVFSIGSAVYGQNYSAAPQLFANQYTQGPLDQATAQMYVSPLPVPPWVGHTYYTYQPLYPHEMLYHHHDRYHSYYDNGRGLNSTRVRYAPSIKGMFGPILPRP